MIFSQFEVLCIFLGLIVLSFVNSGHSANYFKGAMLSMAYFLILVSFGQVPS